jgi:hypothetical protein
MWRRTHPDSRVIPLAIRRYRLASCRPPPSFEGLASHPINSGHNLRGPVVASCNLCKRETFHIGGRIADASSRKGPCPGRIRRRHSPLCRSLQALVVGPYIRSSARCRRPTVGRIAGASWRNCRIALAQYSDRRHPGEASGMRLRRWRWLAGCLLQQKA